MKRNEKILIAIGAALGVAGTIYALWPKSKIPKNAIVDPFNREKYLGLWYEIARLPNRIEKHLKDLTEEYSLKPDGNIQVITRAYHTDKNKIVEAEGTAKFVGKKTRGALKVAYFIPVYLDYNILDIDDDYRYALVAGGGLDFLWILSRETSIPDDIRVRFLKKAADLHFEIGKLEWMDNSKSL